MRGVKRVDAISFKRTMISSTLSRRSHHLPRVMIASSIPGMINAGEKQRAPAAIRRKVFREKCGGYNRMANFFQNPCIHGIVSLPGVRFTTFLRPRREERSVEKYERTTTGRSCVHEASVSVSQTVVIEVSGGIGAAWDERGWGCR